MEIKNNYLISYLSYKNIYQSLLYTGDLANCMGDQEICSVSGRLPYNLGKLALMCLRSASSIDQGMEKTSCIPGKKFE